MDSLLYKTIGLLWSSILFSDVSQGRAVPALFGGSITRHLNSNTARSQRTKTILGSFTNISLSEELVCLVLPSIFLSDNVCETIPLHKIMCETIQLHT